MKIYILIPYRPLSQGGLTTPEGDIHQLPDGRWIDSRDGKYRYGGAWRRHDKRAITGVDDQIDSQSPYPNDKNDELLRAIRFINKNSYFKHEIVVIMDSNVYPNDAYLKEFDNVTILKSSYIDEDPSLFKTNLGLAVIKRVNAAHMHGIVNIADDEWICYSYISDLICSKNWDKPIVDAIQKYGENYVYVPMFTEVRQSYNNVPLTGVDMTPGRIWEEWRRTVCCHSLTMAMPERGYFVEQDMDDFIRISEQYQKPKVIIERPGDRIYGYYAVMFMKAKYAKKAIRMDGPAFDLAFDNRLYAECNLMKIVVTDSYVFHPFGEFK